MSLGRTFWKVTRYARAARFWLLLALAALAMCGVREARAQDTSACFNTNSFSTYCPSQDQAYEALLAVIDAQHNADPVQYPKPSPTFYASHCPGLANNSIPCFQATVRRSPGGNTSTRRMWTSGCPAGTVWNDLDGQKRCMPACSTRPSGTFTPRHGAIVPNGSVGCSDGCQFFSHSNGDGTYSRNWINDDAINHCSVVPNDCSLNGAGYYLHPGLGMCVPPMPECAANEVRDPLTGECGAGCPPGMTQDATGACTPERDTCPAGHIRAPSGECLPGEGQCAVGEARKPDGTCGRDSDNDGTPDEFDPDTDSTSFSGGDNCNSPPSCSGDAIMCGMARIQWRIECNTRDDAKVSGGSCGAIPLCIGKNCKALEYAQLLQQWRATCALEKMAEGGGVGDGDGPTESYDPSVDALGVVDAFAGEGDADDIFTDESANNDGQGGAPGGTGDLDDSGFGWSRSCPALPTVTIMGATLDLNAAGGGGAMCNWFQLAGQIVLILSALLSLRILASSTSV